MKLFSVLERPVQFRAWLSRILGQPVFLGVSAHRCAAEMFVLALLVGAGLRLAV